jgi:hypothetical protein
LASTDILYCQSCGVRVPENDVIAGVALYVPEENRATCRECTQASIHNAVTGTDLRPVEAKPDRLETIPVKRSERRSSRSMIPAAPSGDSVRRAGAQPQPASKAPMIAIVASGVIFLIALAIFIFGSRAKTTPDNPSGTSTQASSADTGRNTGTATSTRTASATAALRPWGPICVLVLENPDDPPEVQDMVRQQQMMARYAPWNPCPEGLPAPFTESISAVATVALTSDMPLDPGQTVLAKLPSELFKGGRVLKDVAKKGKDARAIFGQKTSDFVAWARFDLRLPSRGTAKILLHTVRLNSTPCALAVGINGHDVFQGNESAAVQNEWTVQAIAVPAGIIQAGRNEIRIFNTDASGNYGPPQILVGSVEIIGAEPAAPVIVPDIKAPEVATPVVPAKSEPTFPPVLSSEQRATLQFMENVFVPLAKYDQDTAAKLAATDTSPAGKKLEAVVLSARDIFNKTVAAINKGGTALTVQASSGKLNVSGQVTRIESGKAWIKEKGLEVSVDLAALPPEIFVKALAADESTPDGRLQKALLSLALGNAQGAVALIKRAGSHAPSAELAALLNTYAQLSVLQKFETEVNELAALKEGQLQELPTRLRVLQQAYPQLAAQHKERLTYLASRAEVKR